jgi:NADPH2:quinone reductase
MRVKALLSRECGGPESLELSEVPEPHPGKGEIRIAVRACAINFPDVLIIEDKYQFSPKRPFSPGSEISGVVESLGEGAVGFAVGQRVMALITCGGLAEFVNAPIAQCTAIPESLPFDAAAAFQVTYGTSYHALVDRAALKSGETLLVLGASGGVGLAAIEIGISLGARVVAAVSSVEKAEIAARAGASKVLVYPASPDNPKSLSACFKEACPGGANVIYDPVGGAYAEPALRSIAWDGRYLVVGFAAGISSPPLNIALLKGCSIVGVFWGAWAQRFPEKQLKNNHELLALYARGSIKPLVSERFTLQRGGAAIRALADRKAVGKLVVVI